MGRAEIEIYSVGGALIARLDEGLHDKGPHTISWDGCDGSGRQVSSGAYFYRLRAGKTELSKKMVLAR